MFNFLNNSYSTTVPGTQTRTFLETHVYTGGPKLTLKGDGNLGWNNHNYFVQSERADLWTISGATAAVSTAVAPPSGLTDVCSLMETSGGTTHYSIKANITLPSLASTVTASIYVKAKERTWCRVYVYTNGSPTTRAFVNLSTGALGTVDTATWTVTDAGNGWWRVSTPYTPTSVSNNGIGAFIATGNGTDSYSGDPAFGIYVSGGHVHLGSTLQTYLPNPSTTSPRLDEPTIFSSAGVRLGILLEPAATNLAQYSQAFSTGGYVASNYTIGAAAIASPDGTTTGGRFTETAGASARFNYSSAFNGTGGVTYTESMYVKAGVGRTAFFLNIQQSANNYITAVFDLAASADTGTATETSVGGTSGTIVSTKYEKLPGGWYRLSITGSTAGANSFCFGSAPATTGNSFTTLGLISFTGSTSNYFDAWGFQIETGSVATSPIPTTTASVTRTADTCYRVLGPEWNASAGSMYAAFTPLKTIAALSADSGMVIAINDNTATEAIWLYQTDTNNAFAVRDSGNNQVDGNGVAPTVGVATKAAFAWQVSSARGAANGTSAALNTAVTMPTVTRMNLGARDSLSNPHNMILSQVRLYSSRLTDGQVQQLSIDGIDPASPTLNFDYSTGLYQYTPVNAGTTTTYDLSTLISSGLMTLTGSAKWVRGSNGLLTEVSAGSLAIEYDATGAVLGCINTEPARTNSEPRSNTSTWPTFQATSTDLSSEVNPTGGTGGVRKLAATATSGVHSNYNGVTATAAPWTSSIFAKAAELSWIKVRCDNGTSVGAWFNLSTGVIGTVESGVTAKIEQFANGWYRCSASRTLTATTGYNSIELATADGSTSYDGAANPGGVLLWGAQFEAGSYPSSYIPTTSVAVTRNADVWTLNLGSWFDNSKWIVASKVYAPRANMTAGSVTPALWSLNLATPATTDYAVEWLSSTNRIDFHERTGSTDRAVGNATSLSFPATVRSGFGWSPDNTKASLNGASQTLTGTPGSIAAAYTLMRLGDSERSNVDQGSVYIQSLNILPVVPTQANVNQYAGSA